MSALGSRASGVRVATTLGLCLLLACSGSEAADKGDKTEEDSAPMSGDTARDGGTKPRDSGSKPQPDASKPPVQSALSLPAPVCKVLQTHGCLSCHKSPVEAGAPMSLLLPSDFTAKADDGSPMAGAVLARVQDQQRPMPPAHTGRPMLGAADVATLEGWMESGMKGVAGAACDPAGTVEPPVGPESVPDWAQKPWPEGECEQVFTLGAHADLAPVAQAPTGYAISTAKTDYHCFYEKVPWGNKQMHAIALRARLETPDDMELVHHMVVSAQEVSDASLAGAKPNFNGDHKHCDNPTGSTLAVWAPGSQNPITTPDEVGILLPTGEAYFELQVHYNNPKGKTGKVSKVRYDICATSKVKKDVAGTFWLGYENAGPQTITGTEALIPLDNKGGGKASGVCTAKTKGRILSIMPHMHEQGKHAKVVLQRKSGTMETLIDEAFNFEEQASFFKNNLWVEPGDKIISTCEWNKSPVNFGFASDQEMCFFYTLAYPLDTFKPGFGERGLVGGNLACAAAVGP